MSGPSYLSHSFFIKAEKWKFHFSVSFLEFCHLPGLKVDPEMISAVISWPAPDSGKQLQHFLGFANFYRHVIITDLFWLPRWVLEGDRQPAWGHGQSCLRVTPPVALSERT